MASLSAGTTLREAAAGKTVKAQVVYINKGFSNDLFDVDNEGQWASYTMDDISKKRAKGKVWIVINDFVYDVTEYQHVHPGGSLLLQRMAGKDATDAFENYHQAHVSRFILPRYFVGKLKEPQVVAPHVKAFRAVRQELLRRGMFEVPAGYYNSLYVWLASLFAGSLYFTVACSTFTSHLLGAVLMGLFWQQFAGLAHDLGHSAVWKNADTDRRISSIFTSSLTGLSTAWWKRSHSTHHVLPNSVEDDPDIQHLPIMAVSEKVIEKPFWSTYYESWFQLTKIGAAIIGYQHYLFLPLMAFARFNLYSLGLNHLWNPKFRGEHTSTELFCIMGVFPAWYLSMASMLPTRFEMLTWIFVSHAFTAVLHLQIVVSHWLMDTYSALSTEGRKSAMEDDWYTLQLRTTMDIECPAWLDWFHIGLQFQTVHHLYPTLPRPHLRDATAMVRETCRNNGIPFHGMPFLAMVAGVFRVLSETAALARTGKYSTTRNHFGEAIRAEG